MEYPKELKEAFSANPQGSISEAYAALCSHQKETDLDGNSISWEEICARYVRYIKFCDAQNTEAKYRKHMANWINEKQFINNYDIQDSKRSRLVVKWLKGILKMFMSW